jgi:hypothetical protein
VASASALFDQKQADCKREDDPTLTASSICEHPKSLAER